MSDNGQQRECQAELFYSIRDWTSLDRPLRVLSTREFKRTIAERLQKVFTRGKLTLNEQ